MKRSPSKKLRISGKDKTPQKDALREIRTQGRLLKDSFSSKKRKVRCFGEEVVSCVGRSEDRRTLRT